MARTFALFGGMAAMGGLLLLAQVQPIAAAKRPSTIEKELLGIRILQSYKDVLAKYGQPTRIYRAGETVNIVGITDANGNETGGVLSLGDSTAAPGGGPGMGGAGRGMGGRGMAGGYPGMGGGMGRMSGGPPMGYPGMGGSSGGPPMGYPGMGGSSGGPPMGYPGMGGSSGGGIPGMAGKGGNMPGMAGGGLGASVNQGDSESFGDAGGFQWVYFYPRQELVYWFVFNKDGRVEAILERGRNLGQPTSRGIMLGSSAKSIYTTYGWPDNVEQQGVYLALRYPVKHHAQFNILNNKVTTIAVFLSETQRYFSDDSASGGTPGMGGRGMGMPGLAGSGGGRRPGAMGAMGGGGGGSSKAD